MPNGPLHRRHQESPGQAYFDVYGDQKPLSRSESEDDGSTITWRGDPNETGADATIVVVTNELDAVTYYVHKSVICFGKKQSKYLATALMPSARTSKRDNYNNEKQKMPSVKVELDQRDAENVPIFLDFVYSHCGTNAQKGAAPLPENGTMDTVDTNFSSLSHGLKPSASTESESEGSFVEMGVISTNNAVSLRHLARKFENDALTRAVNKFIQKDLNFKTGPVYLYKAWEYKDERLMDSAQRLCAENIEQIDKKSLIRLPVNLFRVVIKSLESFEEENEDVSLFLSEVVCRYLEKHPEERTAKLILELTDPLLMPYIASEAAIGYTAIVKDLESDDAASNWNELVRLCKRCAEAVVKEYGWSDFSVDAAVDEYLGKHKKKHNSSSKNSSQQSSVDSLLFATSFAAALEQAQDDYEEILSAHKELSNLIETMSDSATLVESVQQRKDEYIEQQRTALEKATEEIVKLRRHVNQLTQQQQIQQQQQQKLQEQIKVQEQQIQEQMKLQEQQKLQEQETLPPQPQQQRFYTSPQKQRHPSQQHERPRPQPAQHQPHPRSQSPQYERPRPPQSQQRPRQPQLPNQHQQSPPQVRSQKLRSSPAPMARHRHAQEFARQQQQQQGADSPDSPPDLLEMKYAPPPPPVTQEIISPTQVGLNVHENKNRARQELRTKSEMRARSLLV